VLGVLAVLSGVGVLMAQTRANSQPIDAALVVAVKRGTLRIEILETGRVEPREKVELKSKLAGQVFAVRVDEGDRVRRGDLLLWLDPIDYEREVSSAEAGIGKTRAAVDFARLTRARAEAGVTEHFLPQAELDAAEHELRTRQAELRVLEVGLSAAQDRVRYTRISSPIDGTVIQRAAEVGEVVVPGVQATFDGKPLLTIADLSSLLVKVDLNQIDVAKVHLGDSASVMFDALPGKTYSAKVTRIAPASSKVTGKEVEVFRVETELAGSDPAIKPGMTADVRILLEERPQVPLLPIEAVLVDHEQSSVKRVLTDARGTRRAEKTTVSIGARNDRELELLSGLAEGDEVLIDPASAAANELKL
jgi:HlyD family secretion protein/macrolide-specific efflux system membrane fusion protein